MSLILLVEDHEMNRILVREILTRRGHEVVEAVDMESARRAFGAEQVPALILLDVQLPGGSGEDLLRELRVHPRLARVPVVVVTAYAMRGDRERFLELGFDGYVSKPIDTRTFADEVLAHLAHLDGETGDG